MLYLCRVAYDNPKLCKENINSHVFKELEPIIKSKLNISLNHKPHLETKIQERQNGDHDPLQTEMHSRSQSKKYPYHYMPWNSKLEKEESGRYSNNSKFKLGCKLKEDYLSTHNYTQLANAKPVAKGMKYENAVFKYYHPGKWRIVEDVSSNEVWTCCMSYTENSKGCMKEHISGGKTIKDVTTLY